MLWQLNCSSLLGEQYNHRKTKHQSENNSVPNKYLINNSVPNKYLINNSVPNKYLINNSVPNKYQINKAYLFIALKCITCSYKLYIICYKSYNT